MYESILVATDGSDGAGAAIEHAIELADQMDATLYGIAVVERRTAYDNAIVDPDEAEQALRDRARDALDTLEAAAVASDVDIETTIRSGTPHEEIVAYADDGDVGAIVIGATGRSKFRRALLGSTVDGVIRLADRPVLVVDE